MVIERTRRAKGWPQVWLSRTDKGGMDIYESDYETSIFSDFMPVGLGELTQATHILVTDYSLAPGPEGYISTKISLVQRLYKDDQDCDPVTECAISLSVFDAHFLADEITRKDNTDSVRRVCYHFSETEQPMTAFRTKYGRTRVLVQLQSFITRMVQDPSTGKIELTPFETACQFIITHEMAAEWAKHLRKFANRAKAAEQEAA